MRVSILGPTNMEKFMELTGLSPIAVEKKAEAIGKAIAMAGHELVCVFNYSGMVKLVGDAYKRAGGKLHMLVATSDADWDVDLYEHHIAEADVVEECGTWNDVLLRLVSKSDIVVCAGMSSGVLVELGYIKWNLQDSRGGVQEVIGVSDLLREGVIVPEIALGLERVLVYAESDDLQDVLS